MEELFLAPPAELRGRPFCSLLLEVRPTEGRPFEYRRRGLLYELVRDGSRPAETSAYWNRFVIRLPHPEILRRERVGFALTPYIRRFYAATGLATAEELAQAGQLAAAIETYRDLFDLVPHSALRKRIADLQARAGDVDAVERELRLVIESDPNDADALNALGVVVLNRGDAREGEALLRRAVAVGPDFALARSNLGQLLARDPHRAAEAIVHLETFLRLAPEDPGAAEVRETLAGLSGLPPGGREIP
jgi:tetratricopeptide (TPR) repeat protein